MAGVVLETLNVRKLIAFAVALLFFHTAFFLIGGLITPSPHTTEQILMSRCVDRSGDPNKWLYVRHFGANNSGSNCDELLPDGDMEKVAPANLKDNELVFIAQFPHPRDGYRLSMTRWFQQIIAILMLDVKQKFGTETLSEDAEIVFDLRLGYHSRHEPADVWHELARSVETRPLRCQLDPEAKRHIGYGHSLDEEEAFYDCEVLPLFTLASCHYDEYLLNLRIPRNLQKSLTRTGSVLEDAWMVEIHQNGGFTKIWFALKTVVFPLSLLALCFFVSRVRELNRSMKLLEKTIIVLGVGLIFLNCPVEWISLVWNNPFWLVLSDIRQGLFFAILVCFWLVFTGEHMMDGSRSAKNIYWPRLLLVASSCVALCIFELAERGVQIRNPFYSIWSHPVAAKLGIASIVIGALCALLYMAYLVYLIGRALRQILNKRRLLTDMPVEQSRYYRGVIYRFTALLSYTLICAVLTVVFFIFSRATEDQWSWGERKIEYTSAFITGVYGMWNVYVIAVLCLYAPSHKFRSATGRQLYDRLISTTTAPADSSAQDSGEAINLVPVQQSSENKRNTWLPNSKSDALSFLRKPAME